MQTQNRQVAAVYLTHPEVSCWDFGAPEAAVFRECLPHFEPLVCRSEGEFLAALSGAQLAAVWRFKQEWFEHAPELRLLSTPAAGRDYFRVRPPLGVALLHGQFHGILMAETVAGALLAMTRGILPAVTTFADNPWPRAALDGCMRPLRGSRATILGFGRIGTHIGRLLKGLGVRITGVRRRPGPIPPDYFGPGDRVVRIEQLDDVLAATDHLVMALPGGPETDLIIDGSRLARLPAGATLCNVGRGNALDEEALADALRRKHLAGAVLDVFQQEPLPADSPLRCVDNLWILPHASAISPDYLCLYVRDLARQIEALTR